MSWIGVAVIGGSLVSGLLGSHAATNAANTQAGAANNATATQLQMFNTQNQQQAPWRQAGQNALGAISGGFGLGPSSGGVDSGYFNHQFNASDLNANLAPNYAFMLNQGQEANINYMNRFGGGGNVAQGLNTFSQNYAQNAYQQAFANYTSNQTNIYTRLASIAGLGQTAGSNQTTGASQFASGIAGTTVGAGNALAAGQVGSANAISGSLNNAMGWYSLSNMLANSGGSGVGPG